MHWHAPCRYRFLLEQREIEMRRLVSSMLLGAFLLASQGCYQTVIRTGAPISGPSYQDRQWFTIAGLVGLSEPAGQECGPQGLSYAESKMSGMDVLINIGITLAGGIVGTAMCTGDDDMDDDATAEVVCVNAFTTLAPLLLSTRTVRYSCAGGPAAPMNYMPGPGPAAAPAQ
jgi:hypothetical protein